MASSFVRAARRLLARGARQVRRSPGFFTAAVLTLALGIGANAAMFSVVYAVLLKPLPYDQPDRLVAVWNTAPGIGWERSTLCAATYFTYREENRVFEDLAVWNEQAATVTGRGDPERIRALYVTEGFLPVLGLQPLLGRRFTTEDVAPNTPVRVIITHGFWQRRFGGNRDVVGRTLAINGRPQEIIGVLPRTATLLEPFTDRQPDVLAPLQFDRARTMIVNFSFRGVARLKPGVSVEDANRDMVRMIPLVPRKFQMFPALGATWFTDAKMGSDVHPLSEDVSRDLGRVLWVLMGTIAIVFLVACANVANLFLVRAEGRQQELAVRSALGATRGQLARALLIESLGLGVAGGAVGIGLAEAGVRVIRATAPAALPRVGDIALHPVVLGFTALLAVLAAILFGLLPAVRFAAPRPTALKDGGRAASGGRDRHRTRSALVVSEIALALTLLVASGLMIRTFRNLNLVDPGFTHGEQLLTFGLSISRQAVPGAEQALRREIEILDRIRQVPGVQSAGLTSAIALDGRGMSNPFLVEQFPMQAREAPLSRRMKWISPGYFQTMGTRLVAGRQLTWNDVFAFVPVVVINERLARVYWKTPAEAVGKRVRESNAGPWREVIAVVADTRDDGVAQDAPPMSYWPIMVKDFFGSPASTQSTLICVVRSPRTGSPAFLDEIRKAVWSVDRTVALATVRSMEQIAAQSLAQTSFALVMMAIAAGVALLLGVIGVYGVIAYITAQRTREVGIRMALGAGPAEIARLFVRHGAVLACAGIALGLAVTLALSRVMASLLFHVSARDPFTYAAVSVTLAVVALAAGYVPSRRAARMHPVEALRSDA